MLEDKLKLDKFPARPGNSNMSSSISFLLVLLLIFANCGNSRAQTALNSENANSGQTLQPQAQGSFLNKPLPGWSNFWQSGGGNGGSVGNSNIIEQNMVLTGVLEDNISSKVSKAGDVFAIVLQDGYVVSGKTLIPGGSKIVGSIVSVTPAKSRIDCSPGSVQISLQSLVLPDGRNMPINAFIDYNPNQMGSSLANQGGKGIPLTQYGKSMSHGLITTLGAWGSRTGFPVGNVGYRRTGADFILHKGEILPVRLNYPLNLNQLKEIRINN